MAEYQLYPLQGGLRPAFDEFVASDDGQAITITQQKAQQGAELWNHDRFVYRIASRVRRSGRLAPLPDSEKLEVRSAQMSNQTFRSSSLGGWGTLSKPSVVAEKGGAKTRGAES